MSYLLDTHAFLWLIFEPFKLSKTAAAAIQTPSHEIHLSVMSYWEISLKYALGKLILKDCKPEELLKIAAKLDIEVLDLSPDDAIQFYKLPKIYHKDPFDRMLIWQAIQHQHTLISRDKHLNGYQEYGLKVLW